MPPIRILLLSLPFMCSASIAGCQRYAPDPLRLDDYHDLLNERDPSASAVVAYAKRLEQASTAGPAHYDPADGVSLREAEALALFFNPHLRAARLRARVPAAGAAEAGRWEDPELRVDAERIIESVENPWVIGGLLELTFPLSGRLAAEKDRAIAEAAAEGFAVVAQEQALLGELRTSWLEWSAAVERVALIRALLAELDGIVATAEKLRAAGELDPLDARLFRIERLTQAGRLQHLEAQLRTSEIELKSRLGLVPAAAVKLVPELSVPASALPPAAELASLLERHPRVHEARARYALAEQTLRAEVRKQYPDLAVGGGFGTDEGTDRVLGGIGLPLPLWNRNRRAIAEARAAREAARAEAEAEYEQLLADAARATAARDAAASRLRFVESELAPLVDEQLMAARQRGRLGDYNTLVLLESLKAAHDARTELLQARLDLGLATARLNAIVQPTTAGRDGGGTGTGTGKDVQP